MNELKLGIIACLHGNVKNARKFAVLFKRESVDAIILNGDIPSDDNQEKNFMEVLGVFVKTGIKIYIQPGSHEQLSIYKKTVKIFSKSVINCVEHRFALINGYKVGFIPGSDVLSPTGGFILLKDRKEIPAWKKKRAARPDHYNKEIDMVFMEDALSSDILFCHVPLSCEGRNGIDLARFGKPKKEFKLLVRDLGERKTVGDKVIPKEAIFRLDEGMRLKRLGYPVLIKEKNVGNKELRALIEKLKIKKFSCGHIHEAGGRAVTLKNKSVKEKSWSKELCYNAASGFKGNGGIITLKEKKAKFENVKL